MKLEIGAVLFESGDELAYRCGLAGPTGNERIQLLRKFYRGEDLGDYVAVTTNPRRELAKDDVNWDTAGERVKGDQWRSD